MSGPLKGAITAIHHHASHGYVHAAAYNPAAAFFFVNYILLSITRQRLAAITLFRRLVFFVPPLIGDFFEISHKFAAKINKDFDADLSITANDICSITIHSQGSELTTPMARAYEIMGCVLSLDVRISWWPVAGCVGWWLVASWRLAANH